MADKDHEDDAKKRREDEEAEEEAALGAADDAHPAEEKDEDKADDASPRRRPGNRPARARAATRRAPPQGSVGKSLMIFVIIIGGLIGVSLYLSGGGNDGGSAVVAPKWKAGDDVSLEVTLVASDAKDLACGSAKESAGKKCQFEAPNKPTTPAITDDKKLLKPYTTTDHVQFLGAGLWSEPGLAPNKLPNARFSVKCKYKVDGKIDAPQIRWNADGPWYPQQQSWYAGTLHSCTVAAP